MNALDEKHALLTHCAHIILLLFVYTQGSNYTHMMHIYIQEGPKTTKGRLLAEHFEKPEYGRGFFGVAQPQNGSFQKHFFLIRLNIY